MHIFKRMIKKKKKILKMGEKKKKEKNSLETLNPIAWCSSLNLIVNKNARKQLMQKLHFYTHQILSDQIYLFLQQLVVIK